jgi:transposase
MGINLIVVNPADVSSSGNERGQKNDPIDSPKLARSLKNGD